MSGTDRQSTFSGTKEVSERLRFDVGRLETYMRERVNGFAGPITLHQFKGGQSNPTYLVETPSRRYVLRRKPPGKLLPSAHAVDREYRVIGALHAQGFPVAEPVLYCADESYHRHRVLRHVPRRRPRHLGRADAVVESDRAGAGLRRHERDDCASA